MGLGIFSRSSYDSNIACGCGEAKEKVGVTFSVTNFRILRHLEIGPFLVVEVHYPDCKNYEGKKILLYRNCNIDLLLRQGSIDPHFSENKDHYSPIARFEPTEAGWRMAGVIAEFYRAGLEFQEQMNEHA